MKLNFVFPLAIILIGCNPQQDQKTSQTEQTEQETKFFWENANIYFLLTDRFANGDPSNDNAYGRVQDGAIQRSYHGGDIRGIIQKLDAGYFKDLGITALWMTPPIENIHGFTDEGTGKTYAYHGYWPKDWTNIDANLGTYADYKELIDKAHAQGIRVLMDVIINHTGPVTSIDAQWPDEWVRTSPACTYQNFNTTVSCTLVENLPDIKTESDEPVELPDFLVKKWQEEGRYDQEIQELDAFFSRTGYPRAPRFYIIKWLTDYVRELGIDGFRVDTVKHTEPSVWAELFKEAVIALNDWRKNNPDVKLDDLPFYMVGEVYNYSIANGLEFDMGDTLVNFYENGLHALINFGLKTDANGAEETMFDNYSNILNSTLANYSTLNYVSSHDDSGPFDKERTRVFEAGTKLLLSPGAAQIYYGDETARPLFVEGAEGDANLRLPMNWDDLASNTEHNGYYTSDVYQHFAKLGNFRRSHPAVGAGVHVELSSEPYMFKRTLDKGDYQDVVIIVMGNEGTDPVDVSSAFGNGDIITDYYSNQTAEVKNGKVVFNNGFEFLLLGN